MLEGNHFRDLILRIRAGDQSAAAELVRLYEPAIRRAARVRMTDPRLRPLVDSTDISQSVFSSFFVRAALGQFELDEPEQLLRLLLSMCQKKLALFARKQGAARRDYRRLNSKSDVMEHIAGRNPSPSEEIIEKDLIRAFRERLTQDEKNLAELRAKGMSWDQISVKHGQTPEALRKQLARAVTRVSQELELDDFLDG